MNVKGYICLVTIGLRYQKKEKQASDQLFRYGFDFSCQELLWNAVSQMPQGFPNDETCRSLSNYKDGKYFLHFRKCYVGKWLLEQANPDKYLKKKKKIIGYEKVDGVCKEKGWGGSMVQGSCLWGKGGVNWKCSFQGRPTNGNMGNNASTLRLKGKGEKST